MQVADKLRAIVEGIKCDCGGQIVMFSPDLDWCQKCHKQYLPQQHTNKEKACPALAKALLAVLERCDTLPYMSDCPHDERTLTVIRETVNDHLKELGE